MAQLKVGIIGCGEVSQINHLPSLDFLNDLFKVIAISDVSNQVLEGVGKKWNITKRFLDYHDLLNDSEVDAVLITTPHVYHCEQTLAALEAGKHVLVEKPMAMHLEDADKIIEMQKRTGLTVQVGYMRRYATAFEEAVKRVKELDKVMLARVHDVIGRNALLIGPSSKVIRGNDVSQTLIAEGNALAKQKILKAIAEKAEDLSLAYNILLGLSTHDISAMRELLGMPKGVLYAAARAGGLYISAAFDYGDFICQFETGIDDIPRFDCLLEVYGQTQALRVEYNTPYVRNLATRLELTTATPDSGLHKEILQPAFEDNFTREWQRFYHNVTTGTQPKTNPEDYRQDLELFMQIMEKL